MGPRTWAIIADVRGDPTLLGSARVRQHFPIVAGPLGFGDLELVRHLSGGGAWRLNFNSRGHLQASQPLSLTEGQSAQTIKVHDGVVRPSFQNCGSQAEWSEPRVRPESGVQNRAGVTAKLEQG